MYIVVNKIYDENDSNSVNIKFNDRCSSFDIDIYEKDESGKLETVKSMTNVDISTAYIERRQVFVYIYKNGESIISTTYDNSIGRDDAKLIMSVLLRDGIPCIIICQPVRAVNKDYQVIAGYPKEIYETVYKNDFTQKFKSAKKRFQIDNNIHVRDSLSYIDAQLELVTELLLSIIEGLADEEKTRIAKKNTFVAEFVDVQRRTSLLKFKPLTKCLAELKGHKAKLRNLQAEYYESRIVK